MNKELFVSSTPHETKVGLVEDDLLAEVYLERENEYTLAGSIYKGRVTRVLPGMQSAFVDIGLERDAFLYVSDFMDLEEHDDDLTESVPANRAVQDLRPQAARPEAAAPIEAPPIAEGGDDGQPAEGEGSHEAQAYSEGHPTSAPAESSNEGDSQGRDRGSWRRGRRRRGGRRDGRDRFGDRGSESRSARPAAESGSRPQEFGRSQPAGPPAGYTPILLPGESISKYSRWAQQPVQESVAPAAVTENETESAEVPLAAAFPEDEPIFAAHEAAAEPLHEEHEDIRPAAFEPAESASTTTEWNQEFRRDESPEPMAAWEDAPQAVNEPADAVNEVIRHETIGHETIEEGQPTSVEPLAISSARHDEAPAFAAPGTMEEETIEDEEAEAISYESSSDEGYEEFEEETQAAGPVHLNGDARETVAEIHQISLEDSGEIPAPEAAATEAEEDSEELELEEAQAEAEAILDAEARGNGTVDARAEVRAPAATAGYTQRAPRQRPGWAVS